MKNVIIIGASGHGKVVADIIEKSNDQIVGFLDDAPKSESIFGYPILGAISDYNQWKDTNEFIVAIGNNSTRKLISEKLHDVNWYTAIHPSAILAKDVLIGPGTVVMANVVLNASVKVGIHAILNTGAIVEHDNLIGNYTHLSPRVALGGTVHIGSSCHLGIGTTVKNNIVIYDDIVVGAGACVVNNLIDVGTYVGVPARRL